MAKVTPQSISSTYNAVAKMNANFEEIAEALENTLSRDGTGPNQMEADLDMNGFRLLNFDAGDFRGEQGLPGNDGADAYEVAVANGFVGTRAAWLASLVSGGITGAVTYSTKDTLATASTSIGAAFLKEAVGVSQFYWSAENHWDGFATFSTEAANTVTTVGSGFYQIKKVSGTNNSYSTSAWGNEALSGDIELWFRSDSSAYGIVGLDATNGAHAYGTVDYAFSAGESVRYAMRNAANEAGNGAALGSALNWFCIRRVGSTITIHENSTPTLTGATLRHTFTGGVSTPLYPVIIPYSYNKILEIKGVDVSGVGTGLVQADPLRAMVIPPSTDLSGKTGAWLRNSPFVTPEMFGAPGRTATNHHDGVKAAGAFINAQGYGWLRFEPGKTYYVGKQTPDTSPTTPYYKADDIIYIKNPKGQVWIEGNGAVLKAIAGLKYGGYHPTTGVSDSSQAGSLTPNQAYANTPYTGMIHIEGWHDKPDSFVRVENIKLDGNIENITIGGGWGDSGAQILNAGLQLLTAGRHEVSGVLSFSHGTDGCTLEAPVTSKSISHYRFGLWHDCEFHFNGRNNFSVIGGRGITWERVSFSHCCRKQSNPAQAGPVVSNPKYGIDIEPDGGNAVGGLRFTQCFFMNNAGGGFGADSGRNYDIVLDDCFFSGDLSYTHTVAFNSSGSTDNKPGFLFTNCRFYGISVDKSRRQLDGQLQEGHASVYRDCLWSDDPAYSYSGSLYTSGGSNITGDVLIIDSTFNHMHNTDLPSVPSNENVTFRNCRFRANKVGTHQMSGFLEGRTVVEGTGVALAVKDAPSRIRGEFVVNGVEQFAGSKSHDFGALAAGAEATTTVTVPGARVGDLRTYSVLGLAGDLNLLRCYVSANDTVTLRVSGATGGAVASTNSLVVRGVRS